MKRTEHLLSETAPVKLAEMMDIGESNARLWQPGEFAAILRHQLSVPINVELGSFSEGEANSIRSIAKSKELLLNSFGDLLSHPNPPVELLRMTKQFAKKHLISPENTLLPHEIANVLYYASIAAARLRCRRRISKLPDSDLRDGLDWCLSRTWLDPTTQRLLKECWDTLSDKKD